MSMCMSACVCVCACVCGVGVGLEECCSGSRRGGSCAVNKNKQWGGDMRHRLGSLCEVSRALLESQSFVSPLSSCRAGASAVAPRSPILLSSEFAGGGLCRVCVCMCVSACVCVCVCMGVCVCVYVYVCV